jgi:hypothetical protein
MKLSINIIAANLKKYIVAKNILQGSEMSFNGFELYDADLGSFRKDCLYICGMEELPAAYELPEEVNFICCGNPEQVEVNTYQHINLLITEGVSLKKLVNITLTVFKKYEEKEKYFDHLITCQVPLQKIIDFATIIVEMPLCMIDANHNVLAISSTLNSPNDRLWDAMKNGYGYAYFDIVAKSEPKLSELAQAPSASVERISNISGHYIKVTTLFKGNRAVAFLGMHRTGELDKPFEEHTRQLYQYVISKITKRLSLFSDVKLGRGKLFEQFLLDVIEGKLQSGKAMDGYSQKLGLQRFRKYQFGLISFKEGMIRTNYHFAMMDYLEIILHESKCVMIDPYIVTLLPLNDGEDFLSEALQAKLSSFLMTYKCFCVLSPDFETLDRLPKIFAQIKAILPFLKISGNGRNIYYYYEYAQLYCLKVLSENIALETMYHPMIKKLLKHDLNSNTDYLETVKVYLRNNCNISDAANILHMHRNSLLYRIKHIEDMLDSTFENWKLRQQLLFSFACLDYDALVHKDIKSSDNKGPED